MKVQKEKEISTKTLFQNFQKKKPQFDDKLGCYSNIDVTEKYTCLLPKYQFPEFLPNLSTLRIQRAFVWGDTQAGEEFMANINGLKYNF